MVMICVRAAGEDGPEKRWCPV